ncbi:hypothetical protein TURU_096801 [Turdus rufiventris]|nr:hypothetical protein TURU_096801 [Turdus rufiventris]
MVAKSAEKSPQKSGKKVAKKRHTKRLQIENLSAKQPPFPQPFLIGLVFQAPHHSCCLPLDALKRLNILPELRGPELDTILKGTLLAHVQSAVDQNPQVTFCLGTVQLHRPQPIMLQGVIVAKMQDSVLGLVKLHLIGFCPSIQLDQVSLQSPPTFQ